MRQRSASGRMNGAFYQASIDPCRTQGHEISGFTWDCALVAECGALIASTVGFVRLLLALTYLYFQQTTQGQGCVSCLIVSKIDAHVSWLYCVKL